MTTVKVMQGDVGVIFEDVVVAEGLDNLDDVTEVLFLMRRVHRTGSEDKIVVGAGLVVDAETRQIGYSSQEDDLHVDGTYHQAWQLTFVSGEIYTFLPDNGRFNIVRVLNNLRD